MTTTCYVTHADCHKEEVSFGQICFPGSSPKEYCERCFGFALTIGMDVLLFWGAMAIRREDGQRYFFNSIQKVTDAWGTDAYKIFPTKHVPSPPYTKAMHDEAMANPRYNQPTPDSVKTAYSGERCSYYQYIGEGRGPCNNFAHVVVTKDRFTASFCMKHMNEHPNPSKQWEKPEQRELTQQPNEVSPFSDFASSPLILPTFASCGPSASSLPSATVDTSE